MLCDFSGQTQYTMRIRHPAKTVVQDARHASNIRNAKLSPVPASDVGKPEPCSNVGNRACRRRRPIQGLSTVKALK